MTTPHVSPVTASLPPTTLLRRAMAAEWTRLWTVRSTPWCLLAASCLMLFVGVAASLGHDGNDPAPIWVPAQIALAPGQFAFLLVVVLAVAGEYATGAIRSTLQWVPRRGILLVARTVVPVVAVAACAVAVAAVTSLLTWLLLGDVAEVVAADVAGSLGRVALAVAFGGLLAVGISLSLRSTAGTLTALFLLILVLPIALGNTGVPWLVTISDALPGRAIVSLLVVDEIELTPTGIAAVMASWTAAVMLAGGWSLLRRDTA